MEQIEQGGAVPPIILAPADMQDLARAKELLENPGLAARLANLVGNPIEKGFHMLPKGWTDTVHKAARLALLSALEVAMATLGKRPRKSSSERLHKILVGASGGIGGAFGLVSLPFELPISTALMLRAIADIARTEGHNLQEIPIKLSCLEVFALGGRSPSDNAAESSYWLVRAALAKSVSDAATFLAEKGVLEKTAPAVVRLVAAIASRFGVVVSEQLAAKAIPLVGAAGGSLINIMFMDHFQDMARGHFIVRRLEARYGTEAVESAYKTLPIQVSPPGLG